MWVLIYRFKLRSLTVIFYFTTTVRLMTTGLYFTTIPVLVLLTLNLYSTTKAAITDCDFIFRQTLIVVTVKLYFHVTCYSQT